MEVETKTQATSASADQGVLAIAKVYAVAYLNASSSADLGAAVDELASFVDEVLEKSPDFSELLCGNAMGRDEKIGLIDRVVGGRASEMFVNFLKVLAKHDRLELLRSIRHVAEIEVENRSGKRRVGVSSAVALSEESIASIRSALATSLGCEPVLETRIDPSLLGGLVIRVGDTVYDGSLKTQVKQLRARLRERCLNEIQRGRDRFSHPEGN